MRPNAAPPEARLRSLLATLGARAAGWWRALDGRLELVGFAAADDLPDEVRVDFPAATRTVPLVDTRLGIVGAAASKQVTVSNADELPADAGSGLWLRRFGAARSVAVPLPGLSGDVAWVISVALTDDADPAEAARVVRAAAVAWGLMDTP